MSKAANNTELHLQSESFTASFGTGTNDVPRNPLCIPEIVNNIFTYLNFNDIKNCRLVCPQWNNIGLEILGKLSIVKFHTSSISKSTKRFSETFVNSEIPTISFEIKHEQPLKRAWSIIKCGKFFEEWRHTVRELSMSGVKLCNENYMQFKYFNISPLLPENLNKLSIDCEGNNTVMILTMNQLQNVKFLYLRKCTLEIVEGARLTPVEIKLNSVTILQNGESIKEGVTINNFLNFDNLKNIEINDNDIPFDLQGSVSLDSLTLGNVELLNWENSHWEVKNQLSLFEIPVLKKNQMKYKDLEVIKESVNLSALPNDIQRLTLLMFYNRQMRLSPVRVDNIINFPYITFLCVGGFFSGDVSDILNHFKICETLTDLHVRGRMTWFKTSSIPLHVKRIRMDRTVNVEDDHNFNLNTLILYQTGPRHVDSKVTKLRCKNLVWSLYDQDNENNVCNVEVEEEVSQLLLEMESFAVGPFAECGESEFKDSYLSKLVDKQDKYYLFKNGMGTAIPENDFIDLLKM